MTDISDAWKNNAQDQLQRQIASAKSEADPKLSKLLPKKKQERKLNLKVVFYGFSFGKI